MLSSKPNYRLWNISPSQYPKKNLSKQLEYICAYGHLAPSSHNTQPWKFKIENNVIEVHADLDHRLKVADPTNKELYISTGCTIPNLELAAQKFGFDTKITLLPSTNPTLIASIEVSPSKTKDSPKTLFSHINKRHTNRAYYFQKKTPSSDIKKELLSYNTSKTNLELYTTQKIRTHLAEITRKGMHTALSNPKFRQELSGWVRHSWTKEGDGLPTDTLGIPNAASIIIHAIVKSPMMAKQASDAERKMVKESPAIGVIYAPTNTKKNWIMSGIQYQLISLTAQKHKLAISPLSASIEVEAQKKELMQLLKEVRQPMMFFRLGYPKKKFPHSPRRQMSKVII